VGAGEGAQAQVDDTGLQLVTLQGGAVAGAGQRGSAQACDDTAPSMESPAVPAWARVCSNVQMKPVPPLPPTTSEEAAAP
jgi:hypothetical protein